MATILEVLNAQLEDESASTIAEAIDLIAESDERHGTIAQALAAKAESESNEESGKTG